MKNAFIGADYFLDKDIIQSASTHLIVNKKFIYKNPYHEDFTKLFFHDISKKLNSLSLEYPNFDEWLKCKVFPGLFNGEREILIEHRQGKIAGLAIVKNNLMEKKICCLRVLPKFQNRGIGIKMFIKSMEILDTDKPLLSISENNISKFKKIMDYFNFKQYEKYLGLYKENTKEISYNGYLE